ncbi:MAG: hypothetical protein IPJ32_13775 [Sphingobacteriaceae bacterium]|nr:hypothetical protein [Sphingobacteriaceae bacterium]
MRTAATVQKVTSKVMEQSKTLHTQQSVTLKVTALLKTAAIVLLVM